jgi:hypothetical protein
MDKRPSESRPRELTAEEIKAVAGGDGVGHAFGQSTLGDANVVNQGLGPVRHVKPI